MIVTLCTFQRVKVGRLIRAHLPRLLMARNSLIRFSACYRMNSAPREFLYVRLMTALLIRISTWHRGIQQQGNIWPIQTFLTLWPRMPRREILGCYWWEIEILLARRPEGRCLSQSPARVL